MRNAFVLLLVLGVSNFGVAMADGELDNEQSVTDISQRATELPATVVVRVSTADQSVAVMHSNDALPAAQLAPTDENFTAMDVAGSMTGAANELDHDSSTDSWYFYFNYGSYYYPTYYYYNYNYYYTPYYNYNYGGYNYYYYNWNWNYGGWHGHRW